MENQQEVQPKIEEEKYTARLDTRVKPSTKHKFKRLSDEEGKEMSTSMREMIESYVE